MSRPGISGRSAMLCAVTRCVEHLMPKTTAMDQNDAIREVSKKKSKPFDEVHQTDVHIIKNPAYVVKEITREERSEGGCIVEWNEEFEKLTNFTPSDMDYVFCNNLIQGVQEVFNEKGQLCLLKTNHSCRRITVSVCQLNCPFRVSKDLPKAQVIRNVWIYSKDQTNKPIRRQVDIYVFPYEEGSGRYALHILFDLGQARSVDYFKEKFCVKTESTEPGSVAFQPASTIESAGRVEKKSNAAI